MARKKVLTGLGLCPKITIVGENDGFGILERVDNICTKQRIFTSFALIRIYYFFFLKHMDWTRASLSSFLNFLFGFILSADSFLLITKKSIVIILNYGSRSRYQLRVPCPVQKLLSSRPSRLHRYVSTRNILHVRIVPINL